MEKPREEEGEKSVAPSPGEREGGGERKQGIKKEKTLAPCHGACYVTTFFSLPPLRYGFPHPRAGKMGRRVGERERERERPRPAWLRPPLLGRSLPFLCFVVHYLIKRRDGVWGFGSEEEREIRGRRRPRRVMVSYVTTIELKVFSPIASSVWISPSKSRY